MFKYLKPKDIVQGTITHLVVGLGNPGKQYELNRHNAGFMLIDKICDKYHTEVKRLKFKSLVGEAAIGDKRVLLMKPTTFMNNSGEAVAEATHFYNIPIGNVIILYDDISLEPGKLRIRRKGTDGGHNGIKSLIRCLGNEEFPRIKLGVGAKPHPDYNLADWVLSNFSKDDLAKMEQTFGDAITAMELILQGKTDTAMNQYN